ncbi:hypothetical protein B0T19DRAFT_468737 [Cercophora scortea]|uniref:Transmembrane protein n=1 Tax=Cercophora scortea TaxID=314031 RepID=A0AAE0I422_9PEZI|nr:hypothetical protein B0T19DRAFT_468737 [Cercophora scortea]
MAPILASSDDDIATYIQDQKAERAKTAIIVLAILGGVLYIGGMVAAFSIFNQTCKGMAKRWPCLRADGCLWALVYLVCLLLSLVWPAAAVLWLLWIICLPSTWGGIGCGRALHSLCFAPGQTCCGIRWSREEAPGPADEEAAGGLGGREMEVVDRQPSSPSPVAPESSESEWEDIELPKYTPVATPAA